MPHAVLHTTEYPLNGFTPPRPTRTCRPGNFGIESGVPLFSPSSKKNALLHLTFKY